LDIASRIPARIDGVDVDVIEAKEPVAHSGPTFARRIRPLEMGYGASHEEILYGSLGAIVSWSGRPGDYLLSCCHVLAPAGIGRAKDRILQPARPDGGRRPEDVIAWLEAWQSPRFGGRTNRLDAAVARLMVSARNVTGIPGVKVSGRFPSEAELAGVELGELAKRGRTTGITRGELEDIDWSGTIRMPNDRGGLSRARFEGQLWVRSRRRPAAFSEAGDSGALVVETSTSSAVGLLIAGEGIHSVVTPLWRVLNVSGLWDLSLIPE
jgi:hypothetical protein